MLARMVIGPYQKFVGSTRLAPWICSVLVFWIGIDSQFFQLIAAATLPGPIPLSLSLLDDSDDDDMIDLTGTMRTFRTTREKEHQFLPQMSGRRSFSNLLF